MGILEEFIEGTGRFSPFALSSERKFARAVGPYLASALGTIEGHGLSAEASILQEIARGRAHKDVARVQDKGATLRQAMLNEAHKIIAEMQQSGATERTKLSQEAATGRLKEQLSMQAWLDKKGRQFKKEMDDTTFMRKMGMLGKILGGLSPDDIVSAIEGDRVGVATPGGIEPEYENEYEDNSNILW